MATGRSLQLTKQIGEYLVAAELCRKGWIATTFTGNVPDYDIVAIAEDGEGVLVQVKAIRKGSWQFGDARAFLNIKQEGKKQVPGRRTKPKYPGLVCVFVRLEEYGQDRFFVLKWVELQKMVADGYRAYLRKHKGIRPRSHASYHSRVKTEQLVAFEDRWSTLEEVVAEQHT